MRATTIADDCCWHVEIRVGPPRECWAIVWHRGDEDQLTRALDSWADNPELTFSGRDACRARQKIQAAEWHLHLTCSPDRRCRWLEWVSVGAVVALVLTILIRLAM